MRKEDILFIQNLKTLLKNIISSRAYSLSCLEFIIKMENKFKKFSWTEHSKVKMRQYGLSKSKLLSILRKPERKEQGIALGTIAVMRTNKIFFKQKKITVSEAWKKPQKAPGEIWIMYKDTKDFRKVISAWRYPGVSKPGEEIPIPEDIKNELLSQTQNDS